ncbi:MAG: ABC transporter permease [Candidatus Margulisiibacteriota bacterium]
MISSLGLKLFQKINNFGKFIHFTGIILKNLIRLNVKPRLVLNQILFIGVHSLPIVLFTALFVGMAFSVQVVKELLRFGAPDLVGGVVAIAIWRELGPLLTGVVVAGRVGASITAEIGSMKVNEQVEALTVMGQDPISYLALPRVLALLIFMPLLVGAADIIGFFGGLLVALSTSMINYVSFFTSANTMLSVFDIMSGLIKSLFFSIVISLIATYFGLKVKDGAQDVGKKTMESVVVSIIVIFGLNYLLSVLFFA